MTETKRPLKVFLCHAHADRDAVRGLYTRLTQDGVDAWLDKEKLLPGQDWELEIKKAVREADVVVVCLSKQFSQAGFRQKEVRLALDTAMEQPEGEIFIVPARLEECDNLESLRKWHWVDLFVENGYEMLMRALRARANRIRATLQIKKNWLPNLLSLRSIQQPPATDKTVVQKEQLTPRTTEVKKSKRKINLKRFIARTGAVFLVVTALLTLVFSFWNPFTPTKGSTSTATSLPIEIIDARGVSMVLVPADTFIMGSDNGYADQKPAHPVFLNAFYIDKYEVTNAMYKACADVGECNAPHKSDVRKEFDHYGNSEFDNYPIVFVDWNQARAYCEWRGAVLPTEAQWEKAARGLDGRTYPWGEGIDETYANYGRDVGATAEVGSYESDHSPYGVYDMLGNVQEWVADWYLETYYLSSPMTNPMGPDLGQYRALRGGAWNTKYDLTRRTRNDPGYWSFNVGFRCSGSPTSQVVQSGAPPEILDLKGIKMRLVPAGKFIMGSDVWVKTQPVHKVYLDSYYIDQYEVTNVQYLACVNAGACGPPSSIGPGPYASYYDNSEFDNYPVVYVSWFSARNYCEWRGADLPTEAQWEKAARGTDERTYPWGDNFDGSFANFCDKECGNDWANKDYYDGYAGPSPVGSYKSNISPFGIYDMAGNVSEWVMDWYSLTYYQDSPEINPMGPESGEMRVLRGGSWWSGESMLPVYDRSLNNPSIATDSFGFRCARDATP